MRTPKSDKLEGKSIFGPVYCSTYDYQARKGQKLEHESPTVQTH